MWAPFLLNFYPNACHTSSEEESLENLESLDLYPVLEEINGILPYSFLVMLPPTICMRDMGMGAILPIQKAFF